MSSDVLYSITIPVFIRGFNNLLALIAKAERDAKRRGFDPEKFVHFRLAPDQLDLAGQVQYLYFTVLDAAEGLSNKKAPKMSYDEQNTHQLKRSIRKTLRFLRSVKKQHFRGADEKSVPIYFEPKKQLKAADFVTKLSLPNFFFHYTTAYAILRHGGVPLGKTDYLGRFSSRRS